MTLNVIDLKLGADPEVFIWDSLQHTYVSAHNIVPGSKEHPHKTNYGAIQVDGVAAEFNILPTNHLPDWLKRIKQATDHISSLARKKSSTYSMMSVPVARFKEDYFYSLPDEVRELGCNPDYSAYTNMPNQAPYTLEPFRTGAGHVHIGWRASNNLVDKPLEDQKHLQDCIDLVKDLDVAIYPLSHLWDYDTKRRSLYGQRGSFRPKSYGVEYRPLSNVWLGDPAVQAWVFNAVSHTVLLHDAGYILSEIKELQDFSTPFTRKEVISQDEAKKAHDYLVKELEFPPLPSIYLT